MGWCGKVTRYHCEGWSVCGGGDGGCDGVESVRWEGDKVEVEVVYTVMVMLLPPLKSHSTRNHLLTMHALRQCTRGLDIITVENSCVH